jgi:hypothetical protein|nr:MAG TPA: hypothetical protein [Caudoviricetes sp.]
MWISRKKYETLIYRINEIEANQRKLELDMEEKINYMIQENLKEPQKFFEDLNEAIKLKRYINDIINH